MKLFWCSVLALTFAVTSAVDVEKTVKQVQNILQANAGLPRLSRDEIIQLLNDIRAEDAKSKSSSREDSREIKTTTTPKPYRIEDNEIISPSQVADIKENIVSYDRDLTTFPSRTTQKPPSTTRKSESSVVVVLPYTPRDGSSLQELYTRPPRIEVVPASKVTTTPSPLLETLEKLHRTLDNKPGPKFQPKDDFPAELQAFLTSHGLKGKPGQDNFLLPLEGFKPLPPAKVVDGTVQLPENILLTYDLISSDSDHKPAVHDQIPPANFLYEPLRPEFPFELDASPSEIQKTVLPLDLPVRKTKSTSSVPKPNLEPIDYDAIRVIPLRQGLSPLDDVKAILDSEQNKRQAENATSESPKSETSSEASTSETNNKSDEVSAADSSSADTGASIADLEESFGGAAPEQPGDSELPPPRKNGFYWMVDWNSFLEVGDGDTKVNIRFEPKLGDPQMFIPVNVP